MVVVTWCSGTTRKCSNVVTAQWWDDTEMQNGGVYFTTKWFAALAVSLVVAGTEHVVVKPGSHLRTNT